MNDMTWINWLKEFHIFCSLFQLLMISGWAVGHECAKRIWTFNLQSIFNWTWLSRSFIYKLGIFCNFFYSRFKKNWLLYFNNKINWLSAYTFVLAFTDNSCYCVMLKWYRKLIGVILSSWLWYCNHAGEKNLRFCYKFIVYCRI